MGQIRPEFCLKSCLTQWQMPGTLAVNRYISITYNQSGRHDLNVRPLRPERRYIEFHSITCRWLKQGTSPTKQGLSRQKRLFHFNPFPCFVKQNTSQNDNNRVKPSQGCWCWTKRLVLRFVGICFSRYKTPTAPPVAPHKRTCAVVCPTARQKMRRTAGFTADLGSIFPD